MVLGGGGSVGAAWQTALIAAWQRAGVDLAVADLIVGTSAGASVGVQVALGHDLEQQVERYRRAERQRAAGGTTAVLAFDAAQAEIVRELYAVGWASGRADHAVRKRIAAAARSADTVPEAEFLHRFRYLRGVDWPANFVCTTLGVDAAEFTALDHTCGGGLDRAVAAAVAVPGVYPPIEVAGRRYVDGGCLSTTYLDLAAGHDRVLQVLTGEAPAAEQAALADAEVFMVRPDPDSEAALGDNRMNEANAFAAIEAGWRQGERTAPEVARFWADTAVRSNQ